MNSKAASNTSIVSYFADKLFTPRLVADKPNRPRQSYSALQMVLFLLSLFSSLLSGHAFFRALPSLRLSGWRAHSTITSTSNFRHGVFSEDQILCDHICDMIASIVPKTTPPSQAFEGRWLTDDRGGLAAIRAYESPSECSIWNVPIDTRGNCLSVFKKSLERPGISGRRHLLCTAANAGWGKTVMLNLNALWFVQLRKGIAITVTYNDDQGSLWLGGWISSKVDFLQSLAVRILHRLVGTLADQQVARRSFQGNTDLVKSIVQLKSLDSSLEIVRYFLGAPQDTEVLLCVDELSEAVPYENKATMLQYLFSVLSWQLEADNNLFLSVSAYGAVDIVKWSTYSQRRLLLQTLGPLWFSEGFADGYLNILPRILRPFYDADLRTLLPCKSVEDKELFEMLSMLLQTAAGIPRRIEVLFFWLNKFEIDVDDCTAMIKADPDEFVRMARDWLKQGNRYENIIVYVKDAASLPVQFDGLIEDDEYDLSRIGRARKNRRIANALEDVARDTARSFALPRGDEDYAKHAATMRGTMSGYCQLFAVNAATNFAFVPLKAMSMRPPTELGPCGEALLKLGSAAQEFLAQKDSDGSRSCKRFEDVCVAAVLLFVRSNSKFSISQLCETWGTTLDEQNRHLLVGHVNISIHNIAWLPDKHSNSTIASKDVEDLVNYMLSEGLRGMLFYPSNSFNRPSNFYGLFMTAEGGYVLIRMWFRDHCRHHQQANNTTSASDCQEHGGVNNNDAVTLSDGTTVPIISLLFSSNEPQADVELKPNEGIVTINSMRKWLPTAAHALQTITHLREMFSRETHASVSRARQEEGKYK